MGDLDSRYEKCERDIERLRGEFDALRSEIIQVATGVLARANEILAEVDSFNRQMFSNLRAQTDAGFVSLRASIDAASRTKCKDDEPPKLN